VDEQLGRKSYERGLKLKDPSAYDCTMMQFDNSTFRSLGVYEKVNDKEQKISFDDLRVGDKIMSKSVIDLLKPKTDSETMNLIKTTILRL
jgi:hypothetical protein